MRLLGRFFIFLFFIFYCEKESFATGKILLDIKKVDSLFIANNLLLLAQHYNVDEQKALVYQAKVFPNPQITFEQSLVNQFTRKNYNADPTRQANTQYAFQVQQLIQLGGKRNKQITLAKINQQNSEYMFYDILRTLKFELHSVFYELSYSNEIIRFYESELENIKVIQKLYETQYSKGNISFNEMMRLKTLLLELENDRLQLVKVLNEKNTELKNILMLDENSEIEIEKWNDADINSKYNEVTLANILDTAFSNRYDLKIKQNNLLYDEKYFRLQKAQAIPNVNVGVMYDKAGSYIQNYYAGTLNMSLPFFDRNSGNIQASKVRMLEDEALLNNSKNILRNEVMTSLKNLTETENLAKKFDKNYEKDLDKLLEGTTENFKKHNIGLVEFVTYYESYKYGMVNFFNTRKDYLTAREKLNYAIGKDFIK